MGCCEVHAENGEARYDSQQPKPTQPSYPVLGTCCENHFMPYKLRAYLLPSS